MNDELERILKSGRELGYPLIKDESVDYLINAIKEYKPKSILEIGTAIGYSGSVMLGVSDGSFLTTLEKNTQSAEIAKSNFEKLGLSARVNVINVDAIDYLKKCNQKFDFIFLDGPKGQYVHYLKYLINMLNAGGVLFSDNVLFRGYVRGGVEFPKRFKTIVQNMREFLNIIESDKNLSTTIYDVGDGISISIKQ